MPGLYERTCCLCGATVRTASPSQRSCGSDACKVELKRRRMARSHEAAKRARREKRGNRS